MYALCKLKSYIINKNVIRPNTHHEIVNQAMNLSVEKRSSRFKKHLKLANNKMIQNNKLDMRSFCNELFISISWEKKYLTKNKHKHDFVLMIL